jgi:membrane protease YdiL (CAAX protease family)
MELAVMAFLTSAPGLVLALRGAYDPTSVDLEVPVVELVAGLLAALGPAAIALYLLWRDQRLDDAGLGRRPAGFVAGYGALGGVCALLAYLMVAMLISIVWLIAGGDLTSVTDEETVDLTVRTALAGFAIAVTAGVGEEIVYRSYAITRMEEAGYGRAAIVVPWAVFTLEHLYQGWIALPVIGAVSAVFVWLFRWKRSIWPVMVAHAVYDAVILLVALAAS